MHVSQLKVSPSQHAQNPDHRNQKKKFFDFLCKNWWKFFLVRKMYTKTVYFISQISTLKMGFRAVYFITPVYFISTVYFNSPPPVKRFWGFSLKLGQNSVEPGSPTQLKLGASGGIWEFLSYPTAEFGTSLIFALDTRGTKYQPAVMAPKGSWRSHGTQHF